MLRFNTAVLQDNYNKKNLNKVLSFMYGINSKVNKESNEQPIIKAEQFIANLQDREHKKLTSIIEEMRLDLLNIVSQSDLSSKNRKKLVRLLNENPMIFDNILSKNPWKIKIFINMVTLLWNDCFQNKLQCPLMEDCEYSSVPNGVSSLMVFSVTNLLLNRLKIWVKYLESNGIYPGGSFLYNNAPISNDSDQFVASMELLAQTIDEIKNDEKNQGTDWKMTPELELLIYIAVALFNYLLAVPMLYGTPCNDNEEIKNCTPTKIGFEFLDKIMFTLIMTSGMSERFIPDINKNPSSSLVALNERIRIS
jgi:ribosomal protein S13